MSNLIRLSDGEYPISDRQLRRLVPNVSLPREPTAAQLARHGFARVQDTPRPPAQPGDRVVDGQPAQDRNGVWRQRWRVIPPTQEEIDDEKSRAVAEVNRLARERMIREMQLPPAIQADLDDVLSQIAEATTIAEVRAALNSFPSRGGEER